MKQNGQTLDFTNPKFQQWLEACPYNIRTTQQLCFEPKNQKEVELVIEVPIDECAVNFNYYGLSLGKRTKELEERYELIDKQYKKLIVAEVKEKNPVKLIQLEERSSLIHKQKRAIVAELKAMIEAEKAGV